MKLFIRLTLLISTCISYSYHKVSAQSNSDNVGTLSSINFYLYESKLDEEMNLDTTINFVSGQSYFLVITPDL